MIHDLSGLAMLAAFGNRRLQGKLHEHLIVDVKLSL